MSISTPPISQASLCGDRPSLSPPETPDDADQAFARGISRPDSAPVRQDRNAACGQNPACVEDDSLDQAGLAATALLPEDGTPNDCAEDAWLSPLRLLRERASFSSLAPAIQDLCERANRAEARLADSLSANVARLQEAFIESLYEALSALDVDTGTKLTLRLNNRAVLVLSGEHPDKERIGELLARNPEFGEAFAEIAAQSAALRDLRNLCSLARHVESEAACTALSALPGENMYQVSLKGEMNHFYFTR
ncbi:hypothetical protein LJC59_09305 [Desulfovibrio sp. OttesenSCG-928-A18]|nr:hypothetical protein [Desulfovibrio sp. OttesenSCG-928-A18]